MEKIKHEISNNGYFTSDAINYICNKIISKKKPHYIFQDTIITSNDISKIKSVTDTDDIQILFQNPAEKDGIGHWICIHYKHGINQVDVYDSYHAKELPLENQRAIKKLYPKIEYPTNIVYKSLKFKQNDGHSCGAYSCGFAISLALNLDPSTIYYKICNDPNKSESTYLREHLLTLIETKELIAMPIKSMDPLTKAANHTQMQEWRKSYDKQHGTNSVEYTIELDDLEQNVIKQIIFTHKDTLSKIWKQHSKHVVNSPKEYDCIILVDLLTEENKAFIYNEIQEESYNIEKTKASDEQNLIWYIMIPECILLIIMDKYKISRMEAIEQSRNQYYIKLNEESNMDIDECMTTGMEIDVE